MNAILRRGACPSLSSPMQTGDGLLVRINPKFGNLSPRQLAGIAAAAQRHGNGVLEITSRGSLQVRGLSPVSAASFGEAIAALGVDALSGLQIGVGPLAGLDANETADPRPLAEAILSKVAGRDLSGRLAPKVSVVVDGGGALNLSGVLADIRVEADGDGWVVMAGGGRTDARIIGRGDAEQAAAAAVSLLEALAAGGRETRGRDLSADALSRAGTNLEPAANPERPAPSAPVGTFALKHGTGARGFALSFGQMRASALSEFAEAIDPCHEIRLAPGKGLLVIGSPADDGAGLVAAAERLGLVTRADDPRLRIITCAGAPDCASAFLPTRDIAARLVQNHPEVLPAEGMVHVSGCAKQCAKPAGPSLSLVGAAEGCEIVAEGVEVGTEIRRVLSAFAAPHIPERRRSA
ncbi:precorrin-3B synthase [Aquibium sp. LZ166]|uniref:Precorrin-3B synthase n=1 Tax=Aquibium pacificus TaxID=3153579 RepID=A0ABV3SME3_9HYPH